MGYVEQQPAGYFNGMAKKLDVIAGQRFGNMTIIKEIELRLKKRYFLCQCDCGKIKECRFVILRSGRIKSCGCERDKRNKTANLIHGYAKGHLYNSWHSMKQRCLNNKCKSFEHYGGRGIKICEIWLDFIPFMQWALLNGYKDNLTIERINVNGNYEPTNCTWITQAEQTLNTRRNVNITFNGVTMCRKLWANKIGISNSALTKRLENWSLEKALTTPCN